MKAISLSAIFALFFMVITNAHASLICTHLQVCNLVDELLETSENIQESQTYLPIEFMGDPHHFEPGPEQIKQLLTAKTLVSGPIELHPWVRPILEQRAKTPELKTILLELAPQFSQKFPNASLESLSHFWLYPEIHCDIQNTLKQKLKGLGKQTNDLPCPGPLFLFTEKKARKALNNKTIILTHDALAPYLESLGAQIISLRGSHHGERLSAKTLKDLHQTVQKEQQVIWLFEMPIENSDQIKNLVRANDLVVTTNTLGNVNESSLSTLTRVLKSLMRSGQ